MDDASAEVAEPANLRFLRRLVTVLTTVMIVGVVIVIGLLVIRLKAPRSVPLPAEIALPNGATATAFTRGTDWLAVVTADHRILILDPETGALRQEIAIKRPD